MAFVDKIIWEKRANKTGASATGILWTYTWDMWLATWQCVLHNPMTMVTQNKTYPGLGDQSWRFPGSGSEKASPPASPRDTENGCGSKWKTDVGPQMWMSSLVLTIQLLGYLILTHTQMQRSCHRDHQKSRAASRSLVVQHLEAGAKSCQTLRSRHTNPGSNMTQHDPTSNETGISQVHKTFRTWHDPMLQYVPISQPLTPRSVPDGFQSPSKIFLGKVLAQGRSERISVTVGKSFFDYLRKYHYHLVMTNIAMGNGPFIDDVPS